MQTKSVTKRKFVFTSAEKQTLAAATKLIQQLHCAADGKTITCYSSLLGRDWFTSVKLNDMETWLSELSAAEELEDDVED